MIRRKAPTAPEPVKGVPLELGGTEYLVPALNLAAFEQFGPRLESITGESNRAVQLRLMGEVILAALRRNYPEMSLDEVRARVDLADVEPLFSAVLGQSGAVARRPDDQEATPVGESTGPG